MAKLCFKIFLLFCFFNIHLVINAQEVETEVEKRTYITSTINDDSAIVIDGLLNELSWNNVHWASNFKEHDPDENTDPTFQTKFKIIYDSKYLYIAIRSLDDDSSKIEKRLSRRDGFAGDRVSINIDSYHDKRTGFSFTITAAGVKGDEFISQNGNNWDESWNPIWYTATQIDDTGWTAEVKIPFSQLKFGESEEQIWGLQIIRQLFRKDERSVWQRTPVDAPGWVSEFGILRGLFNIQPQKQLEIQPFLVTQFDTYPDEPNNPFKDGSDFKLNGGLDAKIGITNDLTLDVTINPDFGQVEADPGAIALDGFQIFFEEQRPFFIENKNIFDYRFADNFDNLFYSRRIGGSPKGTINSSEDEYVDYPTNTTILGAAKFSGKTKNGWSIGLLESVTGNMFAEIDNSGERRKEIVEPLTNYLIARAQKDFNNNNSFIGALFTATNRNLQQKFNFLTSAAYTGGIDFKHNWKSRNYFFEGNMVASKVIGSKAAILNLQESITHLFQRVDAGHVTVDPTKKSLTGTGGKFAIGKAGGGNWRYNTGFIWRSPELELNDVGFLRQADEIRQFSEVQYLLLKPTKLFRRGQLNINQLSTYDFEGNYNRFQLDIQGNIFFQNNWWAESGFGHKPRIFINTFLRGGPRWRFSEENYRFFFCGSDRRKKFNITLGYVNSGAEQDNFSLDRYVVRMNYQPIDALNISLNTEFEKNPNRTQYVTQQDFAGSNRYILGNIDQQTLSTSLRVNYSINPNLTIQYYGQPFISRGRYNAFNFVANPIAKDLNERVNWYSEQQITRTDSGYLIDENLDTNVDYSFSNPDFSFVQFRSNLVLRWEYIPGSEIFMVWSQGVTGFGDPKNTLTRSLDNEVFKKRPDNTFVIKATYRFL
jgi:hypothetical protein